MKRILLITLLFLLLSGSHAGAHALNGSLTGRYTPKVERWRTEVRKQLKAHGQYSKVREGRMLNMIRHESGGSPTARNGGHLGLLQFNTDWKRNFSRAYFSRHHITNYQTDNRKSGSWSIHRLVRGAQVEGWGWVAYHWKATYTK